MKKRNNFVPGDRKVTLPHFVPDDGQKEKKDKQFYRDFAFIRERRSGRRFIETTSKRIKINVRACVRAGAGLLHVIPNDRSTPYDLPNLKKKGVHFKYLVHSGERRKKKKGGHLENTICFDGIHAQTRPLPAPDHIAPIPDRTRPRPQRSVRPEHRA
jgi:hypothetical protein